MILVSPRSLRPLIHVDRNGRVCRHAGSESEPSQHHQHGSLWRVLIFVAIIIIGAGLFLVFEGLGGTGGSSTGCFFWPIPLIVVCGGGSSTPSLFLPLIIVAIFFLIFSWFSVRTFFRHEYGTAANDSERFFRVSKTR